MQSAILEIYEHPEAINLHWRSPLESRPERHAKSRAELTDINAILLGYQNLIDRFNSGQSKLTAELGREAAIQKLERLFNVNPNCPKVIVTEDLNGKLIMVVDNHQYIPPQTAFPDYDAVR